MAETDAAAKELAEMIARAMEQPGVAEIMAIYEVARQASDAAQESMPRPQWVYQSTNTSS